MVSFHPPLVPSDFENVSGEFRFYHLKPKHKLTWFKSVSNVTFAYVDTQKADTLS